MKYTFEVAKSMFKISAVLMGLAVILFCIPIACAAGSLIANHECTDITVIPQTAIETAKLQLHIAYGHTSHGSQVTDGMIGLVSFMNGRGYPTNLYAYNNGGSGGVLDLRDYAMGGDVGYYPDWVNNTRSYLGTPTDGGRGTNHPEVNVIIWSWCGQASGYSQQNMIDYYLAPMTQLELDYPGIAFVYMTGHLDGSGSMGNLNLRNEQIRNYCIANNKILYDFADIESYDPDGLVNYMALKANDNGDYDSDGNSSLDRNWAIDWQNSHVQGTDWYSCSSAHSQPLNANRKAYGAWWLWAKLAGWNACMTAPSNLTADVDSIAGQIDLSWQDNSSAPNEESFILQRQVGSGGWDLAYSVLPSGMTSFTDTGLVEGTYRYRVIAHSASCDSSASNTVNAGIVLPGPPEAPANLNTQLSGANVTLTWLDMSAGETGFTIERRIDNRTFAVLAVVASNTTQYTDHAPAPSHTYTYRVKASNIYGDSPYSNDASVYLPLVPTTIRLENTSDVDDTFLVSTSSITNYGSTPYLGRMDPPFNFIIKFNLPAALMDQKIADARVFFYGWNQDNFPAGQYLDLHRMMQNWDEMAATWDRRTSTDTWQSAGGDYDTQLLGRTEFSTGCDHCFFAPIPITSMVQKWVDGIASNYGMMLIHNSTARTGLKASEYSAGMRPYLSITYTACPTDSDGDSDVDGMDLAVMAATFDGSCVNALAKALGQ
jgi:hypothetical protein